MSGSPMGEGSDQPGMWRALVADPRHGRLPVLLLTLTVVTGVVDAVSILQLGRVFVANMTGNVVFVGFAVAGAPGFSLVASLLALAGFLFGAAVGGRVARRWSPDRLGLLGFSAVTELTLVATALVIALAVTGSLPAGAKDVMAALLAVAMGVQNSVARHIAVPDLTTTVLTQALTGVAADPPVRGDHAVHRRALSVLAMFGGAVLGASLVVHVDVSAALGTATALLALVSLGTLAARGREQLGVLGTGA